MVKGIADKTQEKPDMYRAWIMVDFLITGLMSHLQEFAWNEAAHKVELDKYGHKNFVDYANFFAAQMIGDLATAK